jgi:hypothetical protein
MMRAELSTASLTVKVTGRCVDERTRHYDVHYGTQSGSATLRQKRIVLRV